MTEYSLRPAATDDAPGVARIYNHYVLNSTVTFDTEPKSVEDRESWIAEREVTHPVIVATDDSGAVIAFGAVSAFGTRPAWSRTVELAVYVSPDHISRGLGPRILSQLIELAREAGHHVLVSRIVSENVPSLRMVERAGFRKVGTLSEVGHKFGCWLDVVEYQMVLDSPARERRPNPEAVTRP